MNCDEKIPDFELCIPHVSNFHKRYEFMEIFKKLNWGSINDIWFYYHSNGRFKTVIIAFDKWYDDCECHMECDEDYDVECVSKIKRKLYNGESYKLMYNLPNYWKCYRNFQGRKNKHI